MEWIHWAQQIEPNNSPFFSFLAENLPKVVVFAVDKDQKIVYWNPAAETLLGYTPEEVLGEHCLKANRCFQCVARCGLQELKEIKNASIRLYNKQNEVLFFRKTAKSFWDSNQQFLGGIEILIPESEPLAVDQNLWDKEEIHSFHGMVTRESKMKQLFQVVQHVAETDTTVVIRGESGTGKELVAKAIHFESHRKKKPFVAINCATLSSNLLDSELFGHVKGAFTGAIQDRIGLFEQAHEGTLFLDEIAELPLETQAKLLRVLEDHCITPLGSTKKKKIDVRILSATHKSLRKQVEKGLFREDLMYRLRVVPLFLPPLRERKKDIPVLFKEFISQLNQKGLRQVTGYASEVLKIIYDYAWPGNIRELRNVVEYAFSVGTGKEITKQQLPPEFQQEEKIGLEETLEKLSRMANQDEKLLWLQDEKSRIAEALRLSQGQIGKAAEILGMSRPTLWRRRKKYNL